MSQHATLSPSSAHRWLACPASVCMEQGRPDDGSAFAAEGSAAHEAAALALVTGLPVQSAPGLSDDDLHYVQSYVDYVTTTAHGSVIHVEQALDISPFTGETDAQGTADAVFTVDNELVVCDLKFGRGVQVDADENEQLALYALAALRQFDPDGRCQAARLVIHQPRLGHVSEWRAERHWLDSFAQRVQAGAARALTLLAHGPQALAENDFRPNDKPCRFCKAKATCPALAQRVQQAVSMDFEQLAALPPEQREVAQPNFTERPAFNLAWAMNATDLVETWLKAVRAEVERRLLHGQPVPGYKLVQGRKGARAWADTQEAEHMLRAMRLDTDLIYERKLISPTTAEKLHKQGHIGPRQWPRLQACITQAEGKPSVAPASDKRPAIDPAATADDFADIRQEAQS